MPATQGTGRDRDEVGPGPVPHDPPDQQAGNEQQDDPWEVDIPEPGTSKSAATRSGGPDSESPQKDVPDPDEAGTARRGAPPAEGTPPANPEPDESPG